MLITYLIEQNKIDYIIFLYRDIVTLIDPFKPGKIYTILKIINQETLKQLGISVEAVHH